MLVFTRTCVMPMCLHVHSHTSARTIHMCSHVRAFVSHVHTHACPCSCAHVQSTVCVQSHVYLPEVSPVF